MNVSFLLALVEFRFTSFCSEMADVLLGLFFSVGVVKLRTGVLCVRIENSGVDGLRRDDSREFEPSFATEIVLAVITSTVPETFSVE